MCVSYTLVHSFPCPHLPSSPSFPKTVIHLSVLKDVVLPAASVLVVDAVPVPNEPESVDVSFL